MAPTVKARNLGQSAAALAVVVLSVHTGSGATDSQRLDRFLRSEMQLNGIPGLSLAIVEDARVSYVRAYGVRNGESRSAMQVDTPTDLASVSKAFTALGLLRLEREGTIDLGLAASTYLPELEGAAWQRVTVRDLIRHRSGLRRRHDFLVPCCSEAGLDLAAAERRLAQSDLESPGGATFSYANSNYVLLAAIVQRMSGVPFPRYMREQVFEPLGMHRTEVIEHPGRSSDDALPHEQQWGRIRVSPSRFLGWYGSSRVKASAEDMGTYLAALMRPKPLDISVPERGPWWDRLEPEYDLGWNVSEEAEWLNSELVLEHTGSLWGADTAVALAPRRGLGAAVLINAGTSRAQPIARAIVRNLRGAPLPDAERSSRFESPDTWSQVFLASAAVLFVASMWRARQLIRQIRSGTRAWSWNVGRAVRAAILTSLAIVLMTAIFGSSQPPLAALPTTIQTALPALSVSVSALLVVAAAAGLAPARRP